MLWKWLNWLPIADPKPRLGSGYKLPVIYAGNKDAREEIVKTLGEKVDLIITDNIRPKHSENLLPARRKNSQSFYGTYYETSTWL